MNDPILNTRRKIMLKTIILLERKLFELPILVAVGSPSCKITITRL